MAAGIEKSRARELVRETAAANGGILELRKGHIDLADALHMIDAADRVTTDRVRGQLALFVTTDPHRPVMIQLTEAPR